MRQVVSFKFTFMLTSFLISIGSAALPECVEGSLEESPYLLVEEGQVLCLKYNNVSKSQAVELGVILLRYQYTDDSQAFMLSVSSQKIDDIDFFSRLLSDKGAITSYIRPDEYFRFDVDGLALKSSNLRVRYEAACDCDIKKTIYFYLVGPIDYGTNCIVPSNSLQPLSVRFKDEVSCKDDCAIACKTISEERSVCQCGKEYLNRDCSIKGQELDLSVSQEIQVADLGHSLNYVFIDFSSYEFTDEDVVIEMKLEGEKGNMIEFYNSTSINGEIYNQTASHCFWKGGLSCDGVNWNDLYEYKPFVIKKQQVRECILTRSRYILTFSKEPAGVKQMIRYVKELDNPLPSSSSSTPIPEIIIGFIIVIGIGALFAGAQQFYARCVKKNSEMKNRNSSEQEQLQNRP